jgi:hypothetical protein
VNTGQLSHYGVTQLTPLGPGDRGRPRQAFVILDGTVLRIG